MAKQNAVWGIDIGQCALKALRCTLDADGETVVADKFDFIEYPKILSHPEADPEELVREALEQFLSRNEVLGDKVAICVSGQAGLSRFFKPPPVDAKTLPDIVKYEVKQQIPFPIEDVIWDWQQLGGTIVDGRAVDAEVGLFAMKREAVFRALRPFDDAGVEVDFVQLSPLSIFNVVCHDRIENIPDPEEFDPENPPESVVVMSMGTDTTDLIVTNGIKLWLRNIPIGGNHFTKQLSREMKLTQAKAEHVKRNARVSENPKAIFKAMRPVFGDLVNEVQRSLTFFQSMEKSAELSEIVLLGNAAKLPGLRQFLNKQLEIDIAKVSEFNKLSGGEVVDQPTFTNNVLSYASCYGLCLQGLKKGQIKTNLLPREIKVERIIRAKKPWILFAVSAIALGLLGGYFFKANAWWKVNKDFKDVAGVSWDSSIKKVGTKDSKSKGFITTDTELKAKLEQFNVIAKELKSASVQKAAWLEFYSALSQAFPKDERIEKAKAAGIQQINPKDIPFSDRKELYVDHVESVFYPDLSVWFTEIADIHKNMFYTPVEELAAAKAAGTDTTAVEQDAAADAGAAEGDAENTGLTGASGWVIEIKGHHFHNSEEMTNKLMAGKTYLFNSFIKEILEKEDVVLPVAVPDKKFSYSDIGITFPTITVTQEIERKTIVFDPNAQANDGEKNGASVGSGAGGRGGGVGLGGLAGEGGGGPVSGQTDLEENEFEVYEYQFVVQMAWTPRTEREIIEARKTRLEAAAATVSENSEDSQPVEGAPEDQ
jgi:type IV pilus assembly protein PilM